MDDPKVVGFAAELLGNEKAIFTADPVLEANGRMWISIAGQHSSSSLRPLTEHAESYIHRLRPTAPIWHKNGQIVALIGPQLKQLTEGVQGLSDASTQLADWPGTARGFAWHVFDHTAFHAFRMHVRKTVRPLLMEALRDEVELHNGDARTYFDLFSEFSPIEDLDYFLVRGLFFQQMGDHHALDLTAVFARDELQEVRSERHYGRLLRKLTHRLNETRLDSAGTTPDSAQGRPGIFVRPAGVRTFGRGVLFETSVRFPEDPFFENTRHATRQTNPELPGASNQRNVTNGAR
ncbi:hypothetical protein [Frigoribacterium sp. CFBP 13707]|uniref:hypothetical protein n=1 Tax=Frigoribacterium sp. CFBP 13707 TaxID=2775313 RepID=UPI001785E358|nr:hypothetical protein [Frigoribacterium sp. CFBP 13707]MBD8729396.1 hypothetical protein [Frigoribacterium sp. CFBP 13707]